MKDETQDIHNFERRLPAVLARIKNDEKISRSNKRHILEFLNLMEAQGLRPTTIAKDAYSLRFLGRQVNRSDFKKCTEEDIVRLCACVERQAWSEKTKRNHTIALKKFFQWLYGIRKKGKYPEIVDWVNTTRRKARERIPDDLLTEEEVEGMARAADNPRDRALVLTIYETGARIGELLNIRVKHVVFNDFGAYVMLIGKTGMRRVPVVACAPALANLIHHVGGEREQFLFLTKSNKMNGKAGYLPLTYAGASRVFRELAQRANVPKRVYPHLFRHSSATRAARYMTESEMKKYFGWTGGSDMPSVYVHLSGRDMDAAVKKMHGIADRESPAAPRLTRRICARCDANNGAGSRFCSKCGNPLDRETAVRTEDLLRELIEKAPQLVELFKKPPEDIKTRAPTTRA